MKPIKKSPSSKSKIASKPARTKKSTQAEVDGPDERRPEVKADEIYGDTKIPARSRK